MSDKDLQQFLPKLGDRIAVRQYCCREKEVSSKDGAVCKATLSLMEKIRGKKRKMFGGNSKDNRSSKLTGNTNAVRQKRRFEIGWKDFNRDCFSQVRQQRGGGTRHLKLDKDVTMAEIKDIAIKLFFPNGKSKLGEIKEFEITLRDHQDNMLDPSTTLLELIELMKLKMLRIYIFTKRIEETDFPKSSSITTTSSVVPPSSPETPETRDQSEDEDQSNIAGPSRPSNNSEPFLESILLSSDDEVLFGGGLINEEMFHDTLTYDFLSDNLENVRPSSSERNTSTPGNKIQRIKLHRGQVFVELNNAVKNGTVSSNDAVIEVEMILPNGTVEKGEDNGGVFRDALAEYWETFNKKCATGSIITVPVTRHDMKETWKYVAEVMIIGYKTVGYFPIKLAKPFMNHCFGHKTQEDELVKTFLQFIPDHEKKIIEQALTDFQSVSEDDEFLDMLDSHEVKPCVREDNFKTILSEVAHKELIQDTAYISDCWRVPLKQRLTQLLPKGGLDELYNKLKPTPHKVTSILQFEEHLERKEQSISTFLKKYIRQCPEERLLRFLRFCTGTAFFI